ncbi:MAG: hypothetical protein AAGB00_09595 [Planctomycetota bacterium]
MFAKPSRVVTRRAVLGLLVAAAAFGAASLSASQADAGYYRHRQYYSTWSYRPATTYYYCKYYHSPAVTTYRYTYHYVMYYPSRPRYRYYYNPVRRVYWGRYEVDENGKPLGYSMLAEKDRKSSLEDIPESAFPKASKMPPIPKSEDGAAMLEPPAAPDEDSPSGKKGAYEQQFPNGPDDDQPK